MAVAQKGKAMLLMPPIYLTDSHLTDQWEAWRNNKNRHVCYGLVLCPGTMVDLHGTLVDLPCTMVDLLNTMVDLPSTVVDFPNNG